MRKTVVFWLGSAVVLLLTYQNCAGARKTTNAKILAFPGSMKFESLDSGSLNNHVIALDGTGLLSWLPQEQAYSQVIKKVWEYFLQIPNAFPPFKPNNFIMGADGKPHPMFYFYSFLDLSQNPVGPAPYKHNPAGLYSMLIDSALAYHAYAGDHSAIDLVTQVIDYDLNFGLTDPQSPAWPSVPYASSAPGAIIYRGDPDPRNSGAGDGTGYIEPDKIGEWGYSVLRLWELTGNSVYLEAALNAANALANNQRSGDESHSPWGFRVRATDNTARAPKNPGGGGTVEEYCADVIGPIRLFDELIRLNLGDVGRFLTVRQIAWVWMMAYPMKNGQWANYFEDIPTYPLPHGTHIVGSGANVNQYVPMETARYLISHPEFDADWKSDASNLISWVEDNFAHPQFGANAIGEQAIYNFPMGSHTSRYASVNALYFEKTGDPVAKNKAFRSFNWATYMMNSDGSVIVGPAPPRILPLESWFSDGYGDYIRHFMAGLASVPEWSPLGEDHLLHSTSVVKQISYAHGEIRYQTFDKNSSELLRLGFLPLTVTEGGVPLSKQSDLSQPGWSFDSSLNVLRIHHGNSTDVSISSSLPQGPTCISGPTNLCLSGARFKVEATFVDEQNGGAARTAQAKPFSDQTGLLWFFDANNIEITFKVLDGRALNGHFWNFYASLSDVDYTIKVTDTVTGEVHTYHNPKGNICGKTDTLAFPVGGNPSSTSNVSTGAISSSTSSKIPGVCNAAWDRLCLLDNRFEVRVNWVNQHGEPSSGVGKSIPLTNNTGMFWFFSADNVELSVKVLDGKALTGSYWVFHGSLTDVQYDLIVTDTLTGKSKTYHNPAGNTCGLFDTNGL